MKDSCGRFAVTAACSSRRALVGRGRVVFWIGLVISIWSPAVAGPGGAAHLARSGRAGGRTNAALMPYDRQYHAVAWTTSATSPPDRGPDDAGGARVAHGVQCSDWHWAGHAARRRAVGVVVRLACHHGDVKAELAR